MSAAHCADARVPQTAGWDQIGAIRLTPIAPSYEASLVKLRVVTGSVGCACHIVACSRCVAARGCVAPSSRGLIDGCAGTPCRPPPIRAGKVGRTPNSACAMTSACSTQLKDAPSTGSAPARTGLPRVGTGVLARETACATLSGLLASFLSHLILLFDPRREHSSVPTTTDPRCRAQTLSRLARRAIRRRRTWP